MYNPIPSKISADKKLEIKFLDCEEINNGRMLWKVSVFYEGANLDEFIFPNAWSYLNFELDNWIIQDEKNRFYYLPIESQSILIDTKTLKIYYLPNQPLSTTHFKGNYFEDDFLIEIFGAKKIKTHFKTLTSEEIKV